MYEVSLWIDGFKEDMCNFETLEEAVREFGSWVGDYAKDVRSEPGSMRLVTVKIQKMQDIVSIDI